MKSIENTLLLTHNPTPLRQNMQQYSPLDWRIITRTRFDLKFSLFLIIVVLVFLFCFVFVLLDNAISMF